jgi:predicted RNase H-like nuclease (RuvC/YqgF family)
MKKGLLEMRKDISESKEYVASLHNEVDRLEKARKRDKIETASSCLSQMQASILDAKSGQSMLNEAVDNLAKLVRLLLLNHVIALLYC